MIDSCFIDCNEASFLVLYSRTKWDLLAPPLNARHPVVSLHRWGVKSKSRILYKETACKLKNFIYTPKVVLPVVFIYRYFHPKENKKTKTTPPLVSQ